jgi:hypothetical protein
VKAICCGPVSFPNERGSKEVGCGGVALVVVLLSKADNVFVPEFATRRRESLLLTAVPVGEGPTAKGEVVDLVTEPFVFRINIVTVLSSALVTYAN